MTASPVSVLPGLHEDSAQAAVILLINDPERQRATRSATIAIEHGLTQREAGLVCALVEGLTLTSAAARPGLTPGSARQYLKAVFAKLGVHRQVDLVRRLLST